MVSRPARGGQAFFTYSWIQSLRAGIERPAGKDDRTHRQEKPKYGFGMGSPVC
jgi:hypothetical protein